jgi:hypothetical protein
MVYITADTKGYSPADRGGYYFATCPPRRAEPSPRGPDIGLAGVGFGWAASRTAETATSAARGRFEHLEVGWSGIKLFLAATRAADRRP